MKKRMRKAKGNGAIIYTRVSTAKQTLNSSLSTQERKCQEYCENQGYEVIKVFPEDEGGTGRNADRPSFQEALDFCRRNKQVGQMIVFRFNRFFRNSKELLIMYDELLEKYGTRVESAIENCNGDSADDKRARGNIAVAGEYESNDLSEKASEGMRAARLEGKLTNQPPMGLKREWSTHNKSRVVHDPNYVHHIRKMFVMFDKGKLIKEIIETVNADGFQTPRGSKLSRKQFLRILRNIKYAGFVPVDRETEPVPAAFERIVDYELFKRVQDRLDDKHSRPHSTYRYDNPEFPLRRYIRCSICDKPLTGSYSTSKSGKTYGYYHCRTKGCNGKGIKPSDLHKIFCETISMYRISPRLFKFLEKNMIDYYSSDMERRKKLLESLTKRKDVLSKRRQKLIDCILDGKIDQDLYEEQISIVEVGLDNIVEDIDATQLDMNSQTDNIGIFVNLFRDISKLWKHAPLKLRQTLQEAMFNKPEWEHDGEDIIIRKYSEGLDSIS